MDTCLFTGETLGPTTKKEHTIQEALCGRICSRRVSSSSFNGQSSGRDNELAAPYVSLRSALGPLLASAFQPGKSTGMTTGGLSVVMEADGRVRPAKSLVMDPADPTSAIVANDAGRAQFAARHDVSVDRVADAAKVPIPADGTFLPGNIPLLSQAMEIAALKAVLLAFDELLADGPAHLRFTRSDHLANVRGLVRAVIMDDCLEQTPYEAHVMGLQLDKLPEIEQCRMMVDYPRTDFEHILIASADASTGCLDVVWSVFGIDPFGYRLTSEWKDSSFTCIVVAGVLCNTGVSKLTWLRESRPICAPTANRAIDAVKESASACTLRNRITDRRGREHGRAVLLVEQRCDDYVKDQIALSQANWRGASSPSVQELFEHRLGRIFKRNVKHRGGSSALPSVSLSAAEDKRVFNPKDPAIPWDKWLAAYREALEGSRRQLDYPVLRWSEGYSVQERG